MNSINKTNRFPILFNDFINADWLGGVSNIDKTNFNPPLVNIKETDENYTIELAIPGLNKDEFSIEIDNDLLIISSKTKSEKNTTSKNEKYTRKEFNYSSFNRSFNLPDTINNQEIEATYNNGVLMVNLPKKEEAKLLPKRSISIS